MLPRLQTYGPHFTSHDVVKLVAIALMFIDHIGYFFYPDEAWWRTVGRMCFPLFFFLSGYARPSRFDVTVPVMAVLMILADALTNNSIFAVNILVTMLVCREFVAYVERKGMSANKLDGVFLMLFIWALPTLVVFEYGTLAFMYALCGYLVRQQAEAGVTIRAFTYTLVSYVVLQGIGIDATPLQFAVMALGCGVELYILYHYRVETFALPRVPRVVITPLLVLTRYSLYVYFLHFLLFQMIEYQLHPERHVVFSWIEF